MAMTFGAVMSITAASAQTVNVGGEAMFPTKNIIENAINSKDHTTLVAAVKAAGLVDVLQGKVRLLFLHQPMMHLKIYPPARSKVYLSLKIKITSRHFNLLCGSGF